MKVITPKRKEIHTDNIHQQLQDVNWRKVSHVDFVNPTRVNVGGPQVEMLLSVVEKLAEHVESVVIDAGDFDHPNDLSKSLFRCVCFARTTRLKKLAILGPQVGIPGNQVLSFLFHSVVSLEELKLTGVYFSSARQIEEFLATTKTLKTLYLEIGPVRGEGIESGSAFRRGLRRNKTLTKIDLFLRVEGPLSEGMLQGITENRHVQELGLHLPLWTRTKSRSAVRRLVSETTSIRKLFFFGDSYLRGLDHVFLGLKSNTTIQELQVNVRPFAAVDDDADAALGDALRECLAKNTTLQLCKIWGRFGPRFHAALTIGLSQSLSLQTLSVNAASTNVLQHVARLQSASLRLQNPDWALLQRSIQNAEAQCKLLVLDLSYNILTAQNLEQILPSLYLLSELSLAHCGITFESVPAVCDFIRNTHNLKKLNLGFNPLSEQGAANLLDAISASSLDHFDMDGFLDGVSLGDDDRTTLVNFNECHNSIQMLLLTNDSRLVFLNLANWVSLGLDAIHSIAGGLRGNTTLKTIRLPWLELEFLAILGEALTVNHSLESLEVNSVGATHVEGGNRLFKELTAVQEEAVISFVGMLPRMKSLVCIKNLFDFRSSERFDQALISALMENTVLMEIVWDSVLDEGHMHCACNNQTVQFFLELNRLGRHHYDKLYLAGSESKPVQVGFLPHFFARMSTGLEYSSHLYYFLRRTSPELLAGQNGM